MWHKCCDHSNSVKRQVFSFILFANVILLRHCQDKNHARLKFFFGKTVVVGMSWDLIKANLLNDPRKESLQKAYQLEV